MSFAICHLDNNSAVVLSLLVSFAHCTASNHMIALIRTSDSCKYYSLIIRTYLLCYKKLCGTLLFNSAIVDCCAQSAVGQNCNTIPSNTIGAPAVPMWVDKLQFRHLFMSSILHMWAAQFRHCLVSRPILRHDGMTTTGLVKLIVLRHYWLILACPYKALAVSLYQR